MRAHAGSRRPKRAGFTLIEILIVMVIIGVLATMVSLSMRGRAADDRMQAESKRVEQLLRMASDDAQALGLEIGFRQTTRGFEFVTPDTLSGEWTLIEDAMFRPREVPEPFYLELRIDGRLQKPVKPAPAKKKEEESDTKLAPLRKLGEEEEDGLEPQVLILSSGEMTAFTLDLKRKEMPTYFRVGANAMGELTSERRSSADDKGK